MTSDIGMATHADDIVVGRSSSMTLVRATQGAHPATGRWFLGRWGALGRIESVDASRTGRSQSKRARARPERVPRIPQASIASHRLPSSPSFLFHDWLPQDHRIAIENISNFKLSGCQISMPMSSIRTNCLSDAP
jgi:hypothetical protein